MKQIIPLFLALILLSNTAVFAQTIDQDDASSSADQVVDYTLPYPGILPDNPLYFFKAARDKVVSLLITDPLKKAEFDLLMADKRLAASQDLFAEGKKDLAETTVSKGENYFELALSDANQAKKQKFVVSGLIQKLMVSSDKHEEAIEEMKKSDSSEDLQVTLERVQNFEKEANQMSSQK